ncbi:MAG: CDP-alcohol phosphatidyltransferase family protein, partial [Paludibacteraceae bacterium]|nr:CDP-alcohol phosphatidyltransferase family protein [Paludibacteraceae bacterium]
LFVFLAAVFDFCDGMAARLLKAYSDIGKELDSLADVISFGFAPGMVIFSWLNQIGNCEYLSYIAFLIPIFSALRLAKFNVDERQTSSFIGLPTPANAIFMVSMIAMMDPSVQVPGWVDMSWFSSIVGNMWVIIALVILFSYLLVCELPMFSLKFKNLSWKDNKAQFILIGISLLLLSLFQLLAFPFIILTFIVMSIILKGR